MFGPFHRLHSPTQTDDDARQQVDSREIWGRVPRGGFEAQVQALRGRLPPNTAGIEFLTAAPPDPNGHPSEARWTPKGRADVRLEDEYAKIDVEIVRIVLRGGGSL